MLPQRRGRGPDARLRMRVFDGGVDEFHGTAGGVLDFLDHVSGEDCGGVWLFSMGVFYLLLGV